MSVVTDVVLFMSVMEVPKIDEINEWIQGDNYGKAGGLKQIDGYMGGNKAAQADIFGGSFNYFPTAEFIEFLRSLNWHSILTKPQLMIQDEHDDGFTLIELG